MVYYLGRDVKVYLTTESVEAQVNVASNAVSAISAGGSSAAATGSITVAEVTNFDDEDTFVLIDTAGTTHTFTIEVSDNVTTGNSVGLSGAISAGGSAGNTAAAVKIAASINAGTCASTITATSALAVVTLTQDSHGDDGNTTITTTDASGDITVVNFTGGTLDPDFVSGQTFAENLDSSPALTKIPDLTGVDLGISVVDEDITYIGSKTVLKAEIKKETTISLTRKKSNNIWDVVYNGPTATSEGWSGSVETGDALNHGARWGVIEGAADTWYINNGLIAPKDAVDFGGVVPCFGYRVHIELSSTETISIPACQLTGHTISLNADGTTEETCELISHVTPRIGTAANYVRLVAADM
jgi:hypothetical protein